MDTIYVAYIFFSITNNTFPRFDYLNKKTGVLSGTRTDYLRENMGSPSVFIESALLILLFICVVWGFLGGFFSVVLRLAPNVACVSGLFIFDYLFGFLSDYLLHKFRVKTIMQKIYS